MLNRLSQLLRSLQSGTPFLFSNIFKRHGKAWLAHQNSTAFQHQSYLALTMFLSGTKRQMIWMSTSSALVNMYLILISHHSDGTLTALDTNYKVAYAKAKWASEDFDDGMKQLEDVVSSWVSQ